MEVVNLTTRIDDFLGKIFISCIPAINPTIITDKIRIISVAKLYNEKAYPALVYGVSVEKKNMKPWDKLAFKLLDEGQVGLILDAFRARKLYKRTGRKADGIILYGDEEFWREVAKSTELSESEILALAGLFKGHVAGLRVIAGMTGIWKGRYHRAKRGEESYYTLEELEERLLFNWETELLEKVDIYYAYGVPDKISELLLDTLAKANALLMMYIDIRDEKPTLPDARAWVRAKHPGDKEVKEVIRLLKTLHPRAVELKSDEFAYITALF